MLSLHYKNSVVNDIAHTLIDEDIKKACEIMRQGGLILYPTDTVWGIGCDATNAKAVERIYKLKQRCDSKALIVMLADERMLPRYVEDVPDIAFELIDVAVKPLTIVYDNGINMCSALCADDGSVGIRITREEFSSRLCKAYRRPIVSTSANVSGCPTPLRFKDISDEIKQGGDYIVQSRQGENCPHNPSSVIKLSHNGEIKIIRS